MEWAASDPELKSMMGEATAMAQNREVQAMIAQERYNRMDWLSYGAEREALGEARGKAEAYLELVNDGDISIEKAARKLGISTDDFKRKYMRPDGA